MAEQPDTAAKPGPSKNSERLFRVAIALKGIDGGIQLIGALVLAFIPASAITGFAHAVITRDLLGDPSGTLARHLQTATDNFVGGGTKTFAVVYLLAHGVIKLGLVFALARKIVPAYPIAVIVLLAFIVYEIYRAVHTHSIALPFFAAMDLAIVVLVLREYFQLRRERAAT
ncbi:MAG: hypothetical protein JWQ81_8449 [Amycolatopsis sp.]|jgi:uncharacterized membrane protein|uniref:DUF2127 domain-containing protein n=1 Tax=Amycolatopsis sp. TaxID=37632 RepID=UPI00260BB4FE|nr:DUF2127 domain-containing protein [Amycolatopsis sp.]MCU1687710.1 hypothetical protein [Amycolatopsis sp.]